MFGCVNKLAEIFFFHFTALLFININLLLAQASLVSWIIVRDWQIFGHGCDFLMATAYIDFFPFELPSLRILKEQENYRQNAK